MDSTQIERKAAERLAQRDGGNWTDADEAAFSEWQNESTAHRVAVIRIKTIWQQANRLQALGAGVSRGQVPPAGAWRLSLFFDGDKRSERGLPVLEDFETSDSMATHASNSEPHHAAHAWTGTNLSLRLRALAASVLLAIGIAGAWHFVAADSNVYRSAIGAIKTIPLPDGSTVTLNTNSAIHVAMSDTERRIDLDRGEAFFEVAKDHARPFVVVAAGKRIIAVGTKFSVLRGVDEARVVVTEGRVKVEDTRTAGAPATQLAAGNIARAGALGVLVKSSSIAEAETYLSWRSGYIAFRDTTLSDAVTQFNRYNKKQLVLGDHSLADIRIGGDLRSTSLDAFVRVLEQGFPVRAADEGDRIVLTAR